jgi:putative transposase
VKTFIDEHRVAYGVEPICKVMQIAPSTYWLHAQRKAHPELRPQRAKRDDMLAGEVQRVWQENLQVYGKSEQVHRSCRRALNDAKEPAR